MTILYIATALSYLLLLFQYRKAAQTAVECNRVNSLIQLNTKVLNERHLKVLLIILPSIILCFQISVSSLAYLQFQFGTIAMITAGSVALLSVYAGLKQFSGYIAFSTTDVFTYLIIRIVYLIVYEVFFRVVLLSVVVNAPVTVAVAINVVLYAIAHIYDPRKIFILSVPFGIILSTITLMYGSVWPAIIIHLLLSIPYDAFSIVKQKGITI